MCVTFNGNPSKRELGNSFQTAWLDDVDVDDDVEDKEEDMFSMLVFFSKGLSSRDETSLCM